MFSLSFQGFVRAIVPSFPCQDIHHVEHKRFPTFTSCVSTVNKDILFKAESAIIALVRLSSLHGCEGFSINGASEAFMYKLFGGV